MTTRKIAFVESSIEFVIFSAISMFLLLSLFHVAVLALTLLAFMWTFFGFSLLALLLGRRIKARYVVSFAMLNLLFSACLLFILVNKAILKISGAIKTLSMLTLSMTMVLYPVLVIAATRSFLRTRTGDEAPESANPG